MIYLNQEIKMKRISLIFLLVIFPSILLYAQEDITKLPGYVDFGNFDGLYDPEEYTEVNIETPLLHLAAKMSKGKDQELYNLLNNLKLIKVYTFQVAQSMESSVEQKINRITSKLNSEDWERIVRVKDRGEEVNVYLKNVNDNIAGVTVLTFEKDGEAAFINIVGNIDLEAISKLSDKFNIPELDKIKKDKSK
jgi:DNA polymerase III gamma/tau subunit